MLEEMRQCGLPGARAGQLAVRRCLTQPQQPLLSHNLNVMQTALSVHRNTPPCTKRQKLTAAPLQTNIIY
jgi:hypothetical protein